MGILRSIGKSLAGTVFTLSLVSLLVVYNLVPLTSYDSFKSLFSQVASQSVPAQLQSNNVTPEQLAQARTALTNYCVGKNSVNLSVLASEFNVDISKLPLDSPMLRCSDIDKVIPANASSVSAASLLSGFVFDSIYYKNYSCDFLSCIMNAKSPTDYLVFVSSTFNSFLSGLVNYLAIATAASLAVFMLLTETWVGRAKGLGWSLFSIGVAPFVFRPIENIILPKISAPAEVQGVINNTINPILDSLFNNFTTVFFIGIALLILGYVLGFVLRKKGAAK